ncbi:MAG: cytochrome c peroxidase [bacterium]
MLKTRLFAILLTAILATSLTGIATALTPLEELGKFLYFDSELSTPPGQACAACHAPEVGFTGPDSYINLTQVAYPGAIHTRAGNRKPPTAAYGGFSPVLYYDEAEELFIGGMFWDGRATGWTLGDPLAEQAQGPFLNPLEQNNPNAKFVCSKVARSDYAGLFEEVWGPGSVDPVNDVDGMYEKIARSISAFEQSIELNPFTSKYDYYLAGLADLNEQEAWGLELFEGKAMCSLCHISEPGEDGMPPLFTDFTYDNLGIPRNDAIPFYGMPRKWNIEGYEWFDRGLGGFLATVPEYADLAEENIGKFKVPTLRNVDLRPYPEFVKAFGHNGYFKSLEDITHFYNTRDVEPWPAPEYGPTVNSDELGNLGLTPDEEAAVVAFMKTLNDGYQPAADKSAGRAEILSLTRYVETGAGARAVLQFSLPAGSQAQLDVYNVRGQRVARLADGWIGAGSHQFVLEGRDLASGVYLARLVADGRIATTKFSFIK